MKKFEVKKVDIKSVAKIWLTIGLIIGLFAGIMFLFIGIINSPNSFPQILLLSFLAICFYSIVGAVMAGTSALVYNLIAEKIGGIEIHLKERQDERYIAPGSNEPDDHPDDTIIT